MADFEVTLGEPSGHAVIVIDGHDISKFVTSLKIEASVQGLTRLTVELVGALEVKGTGEPHVTLFDLVGDRFVVVDTSVQTMAPVPNADVDVDRATPEHEGG